MDKEDIFSEIVGQEINRWIYGILRSKELKNLIRAQIKDKLEELAKSPINETVPRKLLDEISSAIAASIKSFTEGKEVEDKIKDFVNRKVNDILEEDKKLDAYIPEDLKVAVYDKLEDLLPFILNRLVGVLEDEQIRKRIKIYLYDLVDKLIEDTFDENSVWDQLKLGLMESFVMSTEEMKLKIDKGVDEGIPQVAQVIKEPEARGRIYESLTSSVDSFLEKKVSELNLKDETIDKVKENSAAAILGLIRSEKARVHLSSFLEEKLMPYSDKTPQEIMPTLTQRGLEEIPERVTEYLLSSLWGESTREDLSDFLSGQLQKLAHKPFGRISDYIPESYIEKGRQKRGEVIIQTHHPKHYAVRFGSLQDYDGFYQEEIKVREKLKFPPFSKLILLRIAGKSEDRVKEKAQKINDYLDSDNFQILGPAKDFPYQLRGKFRWQILLKGSDLELMRDSIKDVLKKFGREGIKVNVEPI